MLIESHSFAAASRVVKPHSRCNESREEDLRRVGHQILTKPQRAGVAMFMKARGKCMFLCFQGHPEYESCTLPPELERRLAGFEMRAKARRSAELASESPLDGDENAIEFGAPVWAAPAALIYRSWLNYIVEAKQRDHDERSVVECRC